MLRRFQQQQLSGVHQADARAEYNASRTSCVTTRGLIQTFAERGELALQTRACQRIEGAKRFVSKSNGGQPPARAHADALALSADNSAGNDLRITRFESTTDNSSSTRF